MRPTDIAELVTVGEPRVSPDGRTVAFTMTTADLEANRYRSQVWLAAADGASPPRPFTAGEGRDIRPRWSPRGDELAFVSHRAGDGKGAEIYIAPVGAGGELRRVVSWPEEVEELAWSPDGMRLAFAARLRDEQRYGVERPGDQPPRHIRRLLYRLDSVGWTVDRIRQLFVVAADGSASPRPLTEGPFQVQGLSWSPDGTQVAFASGRHDTWDLDLCTDLFAAGVPAAGMPAGSPVEQPRQLTSTGLSYSSPSWSSDGSRLAFNCEGDPRSLPRHGQIGILNLADGRTELVTTELDRQCVPYPTAREPVWDGDALLFGVEDSGSLHLYRTGPVRKVIGGDFQVTAYDMAGGTIAYCASSATALAEVFVVDRGSGQRRQLTHLAQPWAAGRSLVAPIAFSAISADGTEVPAWAMPPVAAESGRKYPTLLNIHGGPFTQYGNRFHDEFQLQVGAGFAVVYANPRGSSGYSEAWGRAIRWPEAPDDPGSGWGGVDHEDLMAVIEQAAARFDFIDPDRVGVLGGSYGGYMTSWIVGHTDFFKAACSERAVNNLLTLEQTSDFAGTFRHEVGVSYIEDEEAYRRQSPVSYVKSMTTPLLIVHSEDDLRCPINQAEELFVALRLLGRDPEFVRFPGESHELSRSGSPQHRITRAEIILDWFRRHLASS